MLVVMASGISVSSLLSYSSRLKSLSLSSINICKLKYKSIKIISRQNTRSVNGHKKFKLFPDTSKWDIRNFTRKDYIFGRSLPILNIKPKSK